MTSAGANTLPLFPAADAIQQALEKPVARRQDPESSKAAGRAVTASGCREGQLRQVLELVKRHPGSTSLELAASAERDGDASLDRYVIARRLPELESAGLVKRGQERSCTVGRRSALPWWPATGAI